MYGQYAFPYSLECNGINFEIINSVYYDFVFGALWDDEVVNPAETDQLLNLMNNPCYPEVVQLALDLGAISKYPTIQLD